MACQVPPGEAITCQPIVTSQQALTYCSTVWLTRLCAILFCALGMAYDQSCSASCTLQRSSGRVMIWPCRAESVCMPQGKGCHHLSQKLIERPSIEVRYHGVDGLNLCRLGLRSICVSSTSTEYLCR